MDINNIHEYEAICGTPFYVFDADLLKNRLDYLRHHLSDKIDICYAIKANTFIAKEAYPFVDRLEICSEGEYRVCETLGIDPKCFVISGVNKDCDFITGLIKDGVDIGVYTVESSTQFSIINDACERYSKHVTVMLRLTSGNQFGMDEDIVKDIIKNRDNYKNLTICGIQYFSGTQKTSLKKLKRETEYIDAFIKELYTDYGFVCDEFEYGPGLPVYYFEGESFDEDAFLEGLNALIDAMEFKGKITFELGRSIAASCGSYVTRVADIKRNRTENYAIVDGGMHQITYFGQFMAMKHPKIEHIEKGNTDPEKWNLCGSLCTANDILVKQLELSNLKIGDHLVFKDTGAYCMIEGISLFLSRDLPAIIITKTGEKPRLVRNRFFTHTLNTPNY